MKFFLLIFLTAMIGSLNAQITLTQATHVPLPGESVNFHGIAGAVVDCGLAGANQTWDLSTHTSPTWTISNYISPQNALLPTDFPDATVVAQTSGIETYFSSSANFYFVEGQHSPGQSKITYTDKREILVFPLTYNTSYTGTFAADVLNISAGGQLFSRVGTTTITGDGYGTLILPYATVSDVLRVNIVTSYGDPYQGTPISSYEEVYYYWYCAHKKECLAVYYDLFLNGSIVGSYYSYMAESSYTNIDDNIAKPKERITIFPNPASDVLNFNGAPDNYTLNIYNFSGSLVSSINMRGSSSIDISHLQQGMYILEFISDIETYTDKIVVNR
jgi:hypothetical protein